MSNLSEINVAILAGGLGTRLAQLLPAQQKVLAKIRKHPFLEYILHQLHKTGFKNVVICTGYLDDQVREAFGNNYKSLSLHYSKERSPLGTAAALRFALPHLASTTIFVINGDTFCEVDFRKLWHFHLRKKSHATIVLRWVSDTSRYGRIDLGNDDNIIGFQEKKPGSAAGHINAGIYLINKALIAEIPEGKEKSLEKDIFPDWIGKGFYGFKTEGRFIDIGTPESYARAAQFFANFKL